MTILLAGSLLHADDRDLLRATGAAPNVLLILDSGASMVHDPRSNTINFPAGGDDEGDYTSYLESQYGAAVLEDKIGPDYEAKLNQGSKLVQAKAALRAFFSAGFDFNYGFSYYEKKAISIKYLDSIYRVKEMLDTDGDGVGDTAQTAMLDGTLPGTPLRFGDSVNMRGHSSPAPFYPLRYGRDGTEMVIERFDPFAGNRGYHAAGDSPAFGDIRLVSMLVDPGRIDPMTGRATPLAQLTDAERTSDSMWYYPAFDYHQLVAGQWIRAGLNGSKTWEEVAVHHGIDTSAPDWTQALHDWVVPEIWSHQIGSKELYIGEFYQKYDGSNWVLDPTIRGKVTLVEFEQPFVLYDHPYTEASPGAGTLSSVDYQGSADCVGYLENGDGGKTPIVQLSKPDPTDGSTDDNRRLIDSYLNPQWTPIFYFPTNSTDFLPTVRENYIPMTETITAIGRRPIKDTVNDAKFYFTHTISGRTDPLAMCRRNFLILITDGEDSCSGGQAICSAADHFPGAIHTIYLGSEGNANNPDMTDVQCIADRSGGDYFVAGDEDELIAALMSIARDIEERTRGFSSPMVPSVETSTKQVAYISTFTPYQDRSIWQGHLRAYPIDPTTGVVADLAPKHSPKPSTALWDAGNALAPRWDWGDVLTGSIYGRSTDPRDIYYGLDNSGTPTRRIFAYPGDGGSEYSRRAELGERIFGSWASDASGELPEEKVDLHNVLDFMRGVRYGTNDAGDRIGLRDILYDHDGNEISSSSYHWCGAVGDLGAGTGDTGGCAPGEEVLGIEKLGDIFHSTPQRMAAPACFACYNSNYQDYATFLDTHKHRRTVLFAGSNDGMMHAFDAGLWDPDGEKDEPAQYDTGTGRELFAWVPDAVMIKFPQLSREPLQDWTVDGTSTVADVYIDKSFSGTPASSDREWRTLLLWGERRGGRSYVALDITQPDPYSGGEPTVTGKLSFETRTRHGTDPVTGDVVPVLTWDAASAGHLRADSSRDPACAAGGSGCSGSWPDFRWEFTDTSDEDSNTEPDLGQTWSRPLVGFVKTGGSNGTEDRMVMFFGGGYSPLGVHAAASRVTGNFVYGVDVETGKILLKKQVDGMVPGDIQALDLDLDGFLEKLYFGTTAGNVYRIDLTVVGTPGADGRVRNWTPVKIFDAVGYQPFFMRPTLVPVSFNIDGSADLAIAIGAGNRDAIFEKNILPHRFYTFLDPPSGTVITDAVLQPLNLNSAAADAAANYLQSGTTEGWYLDLYDSASTENWEKVNTPALILGSYIVFSTFNPTAHVTAIPIYADDGVTIIGYTCRRGGSARTYVVDLFNADPQPGEARFQDLGDGTAMATEPVVYLGADGKIHVVQATDNLQMKEPVSSKDAQVMMVDWKEK